MVTLKRAFLLSLCRVLFGLIIFVLGFVAGHFSEFANIASAQSNQVFEMRTYTTHPGRLDALNARFRAHTTRIFEKHSIRNIGYWTPQDAKDHPDRTLGYIIAHDSRDAATKNWQSFRDDPEWAQVAEESQRDGRIVANVESVFLRATDYSGIN